MTMLDNKPTAFDLRPLSASATVSTGFSTACGAVGATGTVAGSCMTNSQLVASARYPIGAATRMRRASTHTDRPGVDTRLFPMAAGFTPN